VCGGKRAFACDVDHRGAAPVTICANSIRC
jgi:hypothetical protein